eukprot:Partr_v1_DN27930_c1_g2_i1_m11842 putative cyclic nucleotide-binding
MRTPTPASTTQPEIINSTMQQEVNNKNTMSPLNPKRTSTNSINGTSASGLRSSRSSQEWESQNRLSSAGTTEEAGNISLSISDLSHIIRSNPLFANAPMAFIQDLERRMNYRHLQPGDSIIKEGELGRAMFFIIRGLVTVSSKDGESVFADLGPGQFFGEIGLFFEIPRTADVHAKSRSFLAVLTKAGLDEILPKYPEMMDEIMLEANDRYELLMKKRKQDVSSCRLAIAEYHVFDFQQYTPQCLEWADKHPLVAGDRTSHAVDAVLLASGDVSQYLYLITAGSVSLLDADKRKYKTLAAGTFFGALGVLFGVPLSTSFVAEAGCETIRLNNDAVNKIMQLDSVSEQRFHRESARVRNYEAILERRRKLELDRQSRRVSTGNSDGKLTRTLSAGAFPNQPAIFAKAPFATSASAHTMSTEFPVGISEAFIEEDALQELIGHEIDRVSLPSSHGSSKRASIEAADVESTKLPDVSNVQKTIEETANEKSSEKSSSSSLSSLPTSDESDDDIEEPEGKAAVRFNPALNFDRGARRASVAVWADSKLSEFASQQAARMAEPKTNNVSRFEQVNAEVTKSAYSIAEEDEDDEGEGGDIILRKRTLTILFSSLDFRTMWQMRAVCKTWKSIIETSPSLMSKIDLSASNKLIDDKALELITTIAGSHVEILVIKNCWKLTNTGMRSIGNRCPNLEVIDLSGCWDITDDGVTALSIGCKRVKSVDFSNCRKVSDRGLFSLITNCTNVIDIYLSYCKVLTDMTMENVKNLCPNIRRVNIQRCLGITDNGFYAFGTVTHHKLHELMLQDCSFLTDASMKHIATSCPNLRLLNISFCCALTEEGINIITEACLQLKALDASFCGNAISDDTISNIATRLTKLERLSIRGCVQVTDIGVQKLIDAAHALTRLNISNCKGITDSLKPKFPVKWQLLNAQMPIAEASGIAGNESFGSSHIRRFTAP